MTKKVEGSNSVPLEDDATNYEVKASKYFAEKDKPLRTAVMLHAEPVWLAVILSTVVIEFQMILYNISFRGKILEVTEESNAYTMQSYLTIMDALYFVDFMLAWSYKSWKSMSVVSSIQPRKTLWLIVDVISLIPIDTLLWHGSKLATVNPRAFHLWSINHLIRIYRVNAFFNLTRNSMTYLSIQIHILEILTVLLVVSMIGTVIMFEWKVDVAKGQFAWLKEIVDRSSDITKYKALDWFWVSFYVVFGHISSHGTIELYLETNHFPFTIFAMIGAIIVRSILLAYAVDIIHRRDYAKSIFDMKRMILGELLTSAVTKPTKEQIYKYYAFFWESQGGQNCRMSEFNMYPLVFRAECSLELAWDTFKHSKLFRHMPVPFLRKLSLLCERKFVLPGDFIIKKFELKDRLIYIVSGSVYVLSEEDNETPILSFSGGTVFGEISLFASYRSRVSILACTPCELNVIERNKFARTIVPTYPGIYDELIRAIDTRLRSAKFMVEIGVYLQKNQNIFENNRNTDVAWLKASLGALQGARRLDGRAEEIRERASLMEKVYAVTDIRYTFMYLDTVVLSDNIALTSDAVFLQSSKCPWIFKPDSPVLQLWDTVVLICTVILSYLILVTLTFYELQTDSVYAWINILGLVLTADLWVTLSTAIQKNDRITIIKVSQILKIRLHNWSFWLDLLSAIPWTFLSRHLGVQEKFINLLRLNRLLKLYKLEMMFSRIENSYKISLVVLRVIKYSVYTILVSLFSTTIILIITCPRIGVSDTFCPPGSWLFTALTGYEKLHNRILSYSLLVVLQIIIGIGTPIAKPDSPSECVYWMILMIAGSLLLIYYIASLTSARVLGQVIVARHFHLGRAIHYHLSQITVSEVLKKRVDAYLETQLCYDKGYRMATNEDVLSTLPQEVAGTWKYERFGHIISNIPLFMEIDQGFVKDMCSIIKIGVLPPKELLSYGGRHCNEMYIIEKGYCEMIHMEQSIPHRKVGPGTAIYVVEMCLKLPVVHTVVTSTYVSFLTINRNDFLRIYSNYPEEKFEFDQLMAEMHRMDRVLELREVIKDQPEFIEVLHSHRPPVPSFTFFVYTLNKEDPEYYVINEPFEHLKNLKFIKWFLLRLTLRPDGMFIKFYEAQRCVCAILTVIFYTTRIVVEAHKLGMFATKVIILLSFTAVVDIYVRMHVGYFDEKGLLVTHPLATATNYMKTSMFVDILGILPFEQLMLRNATSTDHFYFYLTRVLQLHRVVGATNYLQSSDSWSKIIKYGKFLPILFVMAHVFACVILYSSCIFDMKYEGDENFEAGLRCPEEQSFIATSSEYKLTVWMVYRRSLYIATSTLMRFGVEELQIKTPLMMNIFYIMSAVTLIVLLLLMGQIMADSAIRDGELTAYQDRMTTMVKFLNNKRISPELHDEVVSYFELAWKDKRGQSVDQLLKSFHSALREDMLCALFAKSLSKCPGFANASEGFHRYLLINMKGVWFYPNGSVVVHYNDVIALVVIIHSGSAEVVAPDGSFITTLGPGSIFGNLIGSTTVRMPVSIVITSHTRVLVIDSDAFFRALNLHSKSKRSFLNAMELNTDYIQGIVDEQNRIVVANENSTSKEQSEQNTTIFLRIFHLLSMRVVDPNWLPIVLWNRNSLFFSCYVSPCAIMYQIAYGDFHGYLIIYHYLTDFIFLATMYLKVHMAFEDTYGNIVRDKKRIWVRYIKSPMGFYVHLASVLPIEVISFMFQGKTMQKLFAFLRINRILRLAVVVDFFNVQCKRLNVNIFKMRLVYLVMILFFTIHLAACVLVALTSKIDVFDLEDSLRISIYFGNTFHVAALYGGSVTGRLPMASPWYHVVFILVLEIAMFMIFALIVGDMCAMVDVSHYVMITYERLIRRFKIYMETCDLTYILKQHLWTYGCSLWKFNRGRQIPHLVLEAPNYLRRLIKNAMFIHHLENHTIFSGCHEDFLRQVADRFILINFFADNLIVNVGDINDDMYFIHTGKVLTIFSDSKNVLKESKIKIYEEGASFGILSGLFPRYPHRATHRALGNCKILILNRRKWTHLLEHFPASKEHIYSIANKLKMRSGLIKL